MLEGVIDAENFESGWQHSSSYSGVALSDKTCNASATGFLMDGRILVERAQLIAQQHRITYDTPIDMISLVKDIANLKQAYTQFGGARPFGVSILFGGVDDNGDGGEPKLFLTDPTGIFFEFKATVIGENEPEIREILEKEYNVDLGVKGTMKLGVYLKQKGYPSLAKMLRR